MYKRQCLFGARFEILLYDLTSTYFECDPPEHSKRRYGYSRDHRPDCVQVVIALIVTPEGFPLTYEVMPGNTLDNSTLEHFVEAIEEQYGRAQRIWLMDRGIPTEEVLEKLRQREVPVRYPVSYTHLDVYKRQSSARAVVQLQVAVCTRTAQVLRTAARQCQLARTADGTVIGNITRYR